MSDFLKFLTPSEEQKIEVGTISGQRTDGQYAVTIKDQTYYMESAAGYSLSAGAAVIVSNIGRDRYIVGDTGRLRNSTITEVIIDG